LNGGHSKETAKVFRNVGKKTIAFNTYCPKIITGIQADNLLKTLTSRSIVIRLAPAKRKIASRIDDLVLGKIKEDEFSSVATNLKIWSETNKENFKTAYVKAIDFFEKENQSRNLDNWKPIFAIAFMSNLGKNRAHVLVDSALKTMNEQSNSSPISDELDLLFKVKNAIENEDERILIANLHSKINPENFESELKTISKNRFAKFLNGYGIHCRRSKSERYYLKADFIEAFDKYLKDYIPL
jgi:hypothetical protein